MSQSIVSKIARLQRMSISELRAAYAQAFGEGPRSCNKAYLWKRIAYRIQEEAEGGISERARRRAAELACDADLRVRPPRGANLETDVRLTPWNRDRRLPPPGTDLKRTWGGKERLVRVLDNGFDYDGQRFKSLSAVARAITGTRWNGFVFFGLARDDAHGREATA